MLRNMYYLRTCTSIDRDKHAGRKTHAGDIYNDVWPENLAGIKFGGMARLEHQGGLESPCILQRCYKTPPMSYWQNLIWRCSCNPPNCQIKLSRYMVSRPCIYHYTKLQGEIHSR